MSRQITVDAEVWVDEVLDEIELDELIEYIEDRGYKVYEEDSIQLADTIGEYFPTLKRIGYTKDDLYRHLCDIVEVGYYTSKDQVIEKLKTLF